MSELTAFKENFIQFLLSEDALKTGDFTTKSGRKTPYFLNFGSFSNGYSLDTLANFYVEYINEKSLINDRTVLFGPAYKGISLALTCAIKLWSEHQLRVPFCFNRKEEKKHGDKGIFVGHTPNNEDELLIIEDVVTAGSTLMELIPWLKAEHGLKVSAVLFAVDRCERGESKLRASKELEQQFSIPTHSLVNAFDIFHFLKDKKPELCEAFSSYLETYGGE